MDGHKADHQWVKGDMLAWNPGRVKADKHIKRQIQTGISRDVWSNFLSCFEWYKKGTRLVDTAYIWVHLLECCKKDLSFDLYRLLGSVLDTMSVVQLLREMKKEHSPCLSMPSGWSVRSRSRTSQSGHFWLVWTDRLPFAHCPRPAVGWWSLWGQYQGQCFNVGWC